ncbi:MAG: FeoB-associated Cys-rich membrane protein [Lentisphaerae bacterium]|nr:FeoB-associated Cys-rich membrane protein [Lentisphaerota bacterium]
MSERMVDLVAVCLAVMFALAWLGFHLRRQWRRKKEPGAGIGACGSSCEGCPFGKNCGGKR